jgi:hypothetical protein
MPTGGGLDWAAHIHHMTDTRQRRARRLEKERIAAEAETRKASPDAVRTASAAGVPDSDRTGGSEPPRDTPESVRGRPRKASPDAVRTASASGVYQYSPTYGRDPLPDHDMADDSPQPPKRAGEAAEDESSPSEAPPAPEEPELRRCTVCRFPIVPDPQRPGRTIHAACQRRLERHSA